MAATFNAQQVENLFAAVKSAAAASGLFARSPIGHEPRTAPGTQLSCVVWLGPIAPIPQLSGLNSTTGRVIFTARVYAPYLALDADKTETELAHAVIQMIGIYSGEITVGGTVMEIDLLGAYGVALTSEPGYLQQDGTQYRVAEITIPVIVDQLWTQAD